MPPPGDRMISLPALRATVMGDGGGTLALLAVFETAMLGLVLAQQTVDRHGGTLELKSAEGEGTTVVVTLPKVRPF